MARFSNFAAFDFTNNLDSSFYYHQNLTIIIS